MREVRFQRALFGRYLNATPMPSWTNGTFGQWRAIHASAAGLFSLRKVSFGRSSPITSCTLRTFLDRPRLIFLCGPVRQCSVVFESELQFGVVLFVLRFLSGSHSGITPARTKL